MAEKRKISFKVKKEREYNENVDAFKDRLYSKLKANVIKEKLKGNRLVWTLKTREPDLLATDTLRTTIQKCGLKSAIKDLEIE